MSRKAESPVCFVLRNPKSKAPTPILGIIRFNNDRVKLSTGFKITPSNWNVEKSRIKNTLDVPDRDKINTYLKELEEEVARIINNLKAKRQYITKEIVRENIRKYLSPDSDSNKPSTLLEFVRWYVATSPTRLVRSKGNRAGRIISPSTIRRYKTTLNGLEAFELSYKRTLTFDNIDSLFYKAFTEWLTAKNYSTNNVSKYIENLKGFMSAAVDEGFTTNQEFRKFANMREDAENIYLTETELQRIYDLNLIESPRLERVRDLFIFAAWTGLRFSDFSSLQNEHIKTDETGNIYLDIKQQKTSTRIQIPIVHKTVLQLLRKYNNELPKGISNQKTNNYLKEICKLAEINTRELKHITKGGKQVVRTSIGYKHSTDQGVEKWELVTTHTARRSFATNMFKRGMPTLLIMKLTGHKKESEFLKYIKVEAEETMDLIRSYLDVDVNLKTLSQN